MFYVIDTVRIGYIARNVNKGMLVKTKTSPIQTLEENKISVCALKVQFKMWFIHQQHQPQYRAC